MNDERKNLAYWLRVHFALGGTAAFHALYEKYPDPETLCAVLENETERDGLARRLSPGKIAGLSFAEAENTAAQCAEQGITVLPFSSDLYPPALRFIKDPPAVLFAQGDISLPAAKRTVAVVGSRTISEAGRRASFLLGYALSSAGITVVSGGAAGTDTYAGSGASGCSGGTVTVLGEGLNGKSAHPLAGRKNTVFVSELFPGTPGRAFTFSRRNRIISGMSAGTVVIEGGEKSGALITAGTCLQQRRRLFVPAQSIADSPGCRKLLEDGAQPLFRAADCIKELFPEYEDRENIFPSLPLDSTALDGLFVLSGAREAQTERKTKKTVPAKKTEQTEEKQTQPPEIPAYLSENARRVLGALTGTPQAADDIAYNTGLTASCMMTAVTELELEGLAHISPGNRISL